ncbi:hypothetical protein PAPYR_1691 [Paratrimastix pyriformis]|uniref:Cadherin-like beta sandwich domain-containing protein n=1 Tax=Paratrimastix pyriformis TaxID=342808 RepID=A0ABQ8UV64_9EUKA|nr:hypothetical protein PAPYR_1691 [Paratrimastix pyriformis]
MLLLLDEHQWGCRSLGRSSAWHAGGKGIDTPQLHLLIFLFFSVPRVDSAEELTPANPMSPLLPPLDRPYFVAGPAPVSTRPDDAALPSTLQPAGPADGGALVTLRGWFGLSPGDLTGIWMGDVPCAAIEWVASDTVLCRTGPSTVSGLVEVHAASAVAVSVSGLRYLYQFSWDVAALANVTLSLGSLSPPFQPDVLSYTATVPSDTVLVQAVKKVSSSAVRINGQIRTERWVPLVRGPNLVTVACVSSDGTETTLYRLAIDAVIPQASSTGRGPPSVPVGLIVGLTFCGSTILATLASLVAAVITRRQRQRTLRHPGTTGRVYPLARWPHRSPPPADEVELRPYPSDPPAYGADPLAWVALPPSAPVRRGRKGNFSWRSDVLVVFSNGHKVKLIRGDRVRPATTQDIDGRYQGPSEFAPVPYWGVVRRVLVITRPASWPDAPSPHAPKSARSLEAPLTSVPGGSPATPPAPPGWPGTRLPCQLFRTPCPIVTTLSMATAAVDSTPIQVKIVDTACGAPFVPYLTDHVHAVFPNAHVEFEKISGSCRLFATLEMTAPRACKIMDIHKKDIPGSRGRDLVTAAIKGILAGNPAPN